MRCPSTKVPFVEPRSVAITPVGVMRSSRWRLETPESDTTMSASEPRPMTVIGSVSSHLSPSTSMMGCSGEADEAVAGAAGPRRFSASTLRVPEDAVGSATNSMTTGPSSA